MSKQTPRFSPAQNPVRDPEHASAPIRTKRAFFLLALTVFIPGGAQVVAGNRTLGRRVLTVTLTCWALIIIGLVVALINRGTVIEVLAKPVIQLILVIVLLLLAAGWMLMFINTLLIIRPRLLTPAMRGVVAASTVVLMVLTGGVLGYGAFILNTGRDTIQNVFASGPSMDPVDGRYNILLMGGDAGAGRTGLRPDSMAVVSIDAKSGRTAMISIPRNLQNAPFPKDSPLHDVYPRGFDCGDECIINALYPTVEADHADLYPGKANPGAEAMMDAATGITGIDVQAYVVIDMDGFSTFIDAMGGVTVESGGWVPYNAKKWPGTLVNTHWFSPGTKKFTGKQALWFARSRDFTTDYHRIRRQQCLQQAMINQFKPSTVLTRFSDIMSAGEDLLETDIPQSQLGSFLNLANKAGKNPFKRLTLGAPDFGTTSDRFSTFPDYSQIHTRVDGLLEEATDAGARAAADKKSAAAAQKKSASADKSASGKTKPSSAAPTKPATDAKSAVPEAIEGNTDPTTVPSTQPDGSPITEKYLVQLEINGQRTLISEIAANNNECSAP
ncbi:LCP family protein [Arthrobacter rhombi]|uniref:LCP family protein n=1 Tax=Arthrobacter rhombi TaxID=71253 RepID=UPI0015C595EA|nr:LCP family protein [Arthrobacter rhombi]